MTITFQEGYDMNFLGNVVTDYQGNSYIPWSIYTVFMQTYHPEVIIKHRIETMAIDFFNDLAFEEFNKTIDTQVKLYEEEVALVLSQMDECEGKDIKKYQKQVDTLNKRINNSLKKKTSLMAVAITKSRGMNIITWFENEGKQISEEYYFPVMDSANNTEILCDTRQVNDNMARAFAKATSRKYGFGLRLWTREKMDIRKGDQSHPIYKGLMAITDVCKQTGLSSDAGFHNSIEELRAEYKRLTSKPTP